MARTTRLAWMAGMGRMSSDFLNRQITCQVFFATQSIFSLLDISRTDISECRARDGGEERTPHRTQHTHIFFRCAPCGTVVSHVHVSSDAPALAQGLMIQVSMWVAYWRQCACSIVIPPSHVWSQPPVPAWASSHFSWPTGDRIRYPLHWSRRRWLVWPNCWTVSAHKFKGWITDFTESSLQGITDEQIIKFLDDLAKMVPQQGQKWIDWDQSRKEQGTWPTWIMVCLWFKPDVDLVTMIDLLKMVKEELEKAAYKIHGQIVKARLEKRPLAKAQAMFFQGLKQFKADESQVRVFYVKHQAMQKKGGSLIIVLRQKICTEFNDVLFDAVVKSSWPTKSKMVRLAKTRLEPGSWFLSKTIASVLLQFCHCSKTADTCLHARTYSCDFLFSRNKVGGCDKPETAWTCVSWQQIWARHIDGFESVFQN